ncbi:FAD-dependent oxidoreductase [Gordonia sp. OPL2]|uniref:FAD-dependent oxidoreductase n=1 Tax=Gordonia sp. OPL2 TaxID=2486274 RepID=UPI00165582C1|nr:FAD-dependent oxidoreductase [Gordonia sp. OPL2]ROZ98574.1 FAD-dependent oxidoreductase [Gordonia sp. OPL2]
MTHSPNRTDSPNRTGGAPRSLAVVGGGVIGLTCALAALDAGRRVHVYDAGADGRAAWVAAGMLGSLGEGHPGEDELLRLSVASVRRWPDLVARLGDPAVLAAVDSLFVAASSADAEHLATLAEFVWARQPRADDDLRRVDLAEIRRLEPTLSSRMHSGFLAVGEGAVDNRRLLARLRDAVVAGGGQIVQERVADLADVDAEDVLVAAGLGTRALLPEVELHAAKGEILRLHRTRWSVPGPERVVRARMHGRSVYLVPRRDGIVVGATQYEPYEEQSVAPEVGGVADLLADATELMPGIRTYELAEAGAGLRPCTADGLPIIRRIDERVVVASGHGRNGILLAPYTADAAMAVLDGAATDHDQVATSTGGAQR